MLIQSHLHVSIIVQSNQNKNGLTSYSHQSSHTLHIGISSEVIVASNMFTRNENTKERLKVESVTERCRKAKRRWFGHVKRRDQDYVGRKTLEMAPPGRRKRGRPKQRWMDCVNRDMRAIGTTKDEVHDRTGWRRIVSAAATTQRSGSG